MIAGIIIPSIETKFTLDFGADDEATVKRVLSVINTRLEIATEKAREFCMIFADGRWDATLEDLRSTKDRVPYGGALMYDAAKGSYLQTFVSLDDELQAVYMRHVAPTKRRYSEFSSLNRGLLAALYDSGYTIATQRNIVGEQRPFCLVADITTRLCDTPGVLSAFATIDEAIERFKR